MSIKIPSQSEIVRLLGILLVKGCPDAEYTLGRMYLNGVGVEENKEEGLKLIRDAGEQGIREAKALLIELSEDSAHLPEK